MMKRLLRVLLISLVVSSCSVSRYASNQSFQEPTSSYGPEGILENLMVPSSERGISSRRAIVYLPKDYYNNDRRYPVLYLLHGARGNELSWIDRGSIISAIDSLRRGGITSDFILVLPNMNWYKNESDFGFSRAKPAMSSFYGIDGEVESYFVTDVVCAVDHHYRTIASKEKRAIAGMSVGALQAIYISAGNPDAFGSIGLFSPMTHPVLRHGENSSFYANLWPKIRNQFNDPPTDYQIMIGKKDFLYPGIKGWENRMEKKGYQHTMYLSEGGHCWINWREYAIRFMETALRSW